MIRSVLVTSAALLAAGCAPPPSAGPASAARESESVGWRTLGSWSGRGSLQTESFIVEGSVVRVRWETRNDASTGTGTFRLTFHSAVSGRELAVAADHRGAGEGESYIPEEPRPAYFLVESEDLDWSFSVEEGEAGTIRHSTGVVTPEVDVRRPGAAAPELISVPRTRRVRSRVPTPIARGTRPTYDVSGPGDVRPTR